jgi:tetratricopeptide (TPR) repeat protein
MTEPVGKLQDINSIMKTKGTSDPVQADYEKGKEFLQKNELAQAAVALHNALVGFEEKGDQNGIANASNQMGNLCLARKDYEQALKHFQRAWDICEGQHDAMSLLALSNQLVAVYKGQGQFERAVSICLDLIGKYQDNNDPRGTVEVMERMAEIYIEAGERGKAADTYRTIGAIHANFKHKNIADGYILKAESLEKAN